MLELPRPDLGEIGRSRSLRSRRRPAHRVAPRDLSLRLYWTPGPPGGAARRDRRGRLAVPDWIEAVRARGQRLATLDLPRRSFPWLLPGTKSTSYATHMAAEAEARRRGADDAVFVDLDGTVLEGTVTNIWWREGERLFTPSLELGILAGETRAALLELAADVGYAVEEGCYPVARLLDADEVFTSSSVREVMPACSIDDVAFPLGPAAARLQLGLRELAETVLGRRAGRGAELLHHRHHVEDPPVLVRQSVIAEANDVDELHLDGFARCRHAHELALMGSGRRHAGNDLVATRDGVLDGHAQVGKRGDVHLEEGLDTLLRR